MTGGPPSAGPPAGWYADTPRSTRARWWNGSAWTDHYQGPDGAGVRQRLGPDRRRRVRRCSSGTIGCPRAAALTRGAENQPERRGGPDIRDVAVVHRGDSSVTACRAATAPTQLEVEAPPQAQAEVNTPRRRDARPPALAQQEAVAPTPTSAAFRTRSSCSRPRPEIECTSNPTPVAVPTTRADAQPPEPDPPRSHRHHGHPPRAMPRRFPTRSLASVPGETYHRPPPPPVTYRPRRHLSRTRPLPGAYAAERSKTLMPLPSRNGAAKASLILILVSLLGGVAAFWWLTGANATLVQVVNLVTVALLVAGVHSRDRRSGRRGDSADEEGRVGLRAHHVVVAPHRCHRAVRAGTGGGAARSTSRRSNRRSKPAYLSDSGTVVTVDCPVEPPSANGSTFLCSARNETGTVEVVEVRVQGESFTWEILTE